jgi:hypothetical protein
MGLPAAILDSGPITSATITSFWYGPSEYQNLRFDLMGDGFRLRGASYDGYYNGLHYAHGGVPDTASMSGALSYALGSVTEGGEPVGFSLAVPYSYIISPQFTLETTPGEHTMDQPFEAYWEIVPYPCDYMFEHCAPSTDKVYLVSFTGTARGHYTISDGFVEDTRIEFLVASGTWTVAGDVAEVANPEPGSMVLAGLGLAVIYWVRRRKTSVSVPQLRTTQ